MPEDGRMTRAPGVRGADNCRTWSASCANAVTDNPSDAKPAYFKTRFKGKLLNYQWTGDGQS
jgi:hypothetical protein